MKNTIKILALGVAFAASTTLAKADPVLGQGQIQFNINACATSSSTSCSTSGAATGILFTGLPYNVAGSGSLNMFNSPNVSFSGLNPYVAFNAPSLSFTVNDTLAGGDHLTFVSSGTATGGVTTIGGVQFVNFEDAGTLTLYSSTNVDLGSSVGYATAGSNTLTFFSGAVVSPTPEPSSLALLGTGLLGLAGIARRKFASRFSA